VSGLLRFYHSHPSENETPPYSLSYMNVRALARKKLIIVCRQGRKWLTGHFGPKTDCA